MSKGANLESGFPLLYDWLPAIQDLDGEGVKELLLALIDRQKNGTPFSEFQNRQAYIYAQMIEPTIKRRLDGQTAGIKSKSIAEGGRVGAGGGGRAGAGGASKAEHSRAEQNIAKHSNISSPQRGRM